MVLKCLGTGSTGNCYLVKLGGGWIILDTGVNIKKIDKTINLNDADFAFVSHEHMDHYKYAHDLHRRGVPVLRGYVNRCFEEIETPAKIKGSYRLWTFPVSHGECPCGAIIIQDLKTQELILYATDFTMTDYDLSDFKFTSIMIECNYCDSIVDGYLEANPQLAFKVKRQINTHMGLEGLKIFIDKLCLDDCKEIILMHRSQGLGDSIEMGAEIFGRYSIPVAVCKTRGGVDWYGRS